MKIALVTSWLNQYGGAERVLEAVHELYPCAPVFTSSYVPRTMPDAYRRWDIRSSFLDRLPFVRNHPRLFVPIYPLAFESLDLQDFDTVISISSAFAHGVRTRQGARHYCYCLTPARFLWNFGEYVEREQINPIPRAILPLVISPLREWDRRASSRVTQYIAISKTVRSRIAASYGRDSIIVHPPVEVDRYSVSSCPGEYYLVLSRLVPYKRIDLAVLACNELGVPLVVAGEGRDRPRLQAMARPNIRFVGSPSDAEARDLLARCRALLWTGDEDFGITPLEANASGKPVIAFAGGGALETVVEGKTGSFFREASARSLSQAISAFDENQFDPLSVRAHAESFGVRTFRDRLDALVKGQVPEP